MIRLWTWQTYLYILLLEGNNNTLWGKLYHIWVDKLTDLKVEKQNMILVGIKEYKLFTHV